jgi:hypothetical protein
MVCDYLSSPDHGYVTRPLTHCTRLAAQGFAITSLRVQQTLIGVQSMEDLLAIASKVMPNLRTLELIDVKGDHTLRNIEKTTSLTTLKLISFRYFEESLPKALVNLERLVLKPDYPSMRWVGCRALLCLKRLQHLSLCLLTLVYQELRELLVGMPQLKSLELAPHHPAYSPTLFRLPHDYLPRLFEGNPLPELRGLYIREVTGASMDAQMLTFLGGMPSLKSVHLECPFVGDLQALFEALNACVGLTELGLSLPTLEAGLPIGDFSNLKTLSALYLVATPETVPPGLTEKVFSTFPNMVDFKYNQEGSVFRGMPLSVPNVKR